MKIEELGRGSVTGERWTTFAIFLLPILIGILCWADGSGTGDSIAYREMIEAAWQQGSIPATRVEWFHPGQYLIAAPIFGLGQWLGLWTEPLQVCSLLNFLGMGLAAWTVMRATMHLFPDRSFALSIFAGLATVTTPGWLWHSQDAMTDVLGHSLVLIWSARLLIHECKARAGEEDGPDSSGARVYFSWGLTGFLATYAILVRLSSALFVMLFLYLAVRALVATADRRARISKSLALLLGGALPVVCMFSHLILAHGWTEFWSIYLEIGSSNAGMRVSFQVLQDVWLERVTNGTGPLLLWAGVSAAAILGFQMIRPSTRRIFQSRTPLFWICVLLTVPYFVAVARNRAWYEFRFLLPAMMILSLATTTWAWLGDRILGVWAPAILGIALVSANLLYAGPWLYTFATRSHFLEVAVKQTIHVAEPGSILLGHGSAPHMRYRGRGRFVVNSVRADSSEEGIDFWNASWSTVRESLHNAYANRRAAYFFNENGLSRFIEDLEKRHWTKELVYERSFEGLRNAEDENLSLMELDFALKPRQLKILRLIPPKGLQPAIALKVGGGTADAPGYSFAITSPDHAGWKYRVLFSSAIQSKGFITPGQLFLRFSSEDPLLVKSYAVSQESPEPLNHLIGTLDAKGRASLRLPSHLSGSITGAYVTVLLHRPSIPWKQSRTRSPTQRIR